MSNSYIKQPTRICCGPTSLYNLLVWAGHPTSKDLSYRNLVKMCECCEPHGTLYEGFSKSLQYVAQKANLKIAPVVMDPKVDELAGLINDKTCAIIENHWREMHDGELKTGEHFMLLDKITDAGFNLVNHDDDGAESSVEQVFSRRAMRRLLSKMVYDPPKYEDSRDNVYPKVWVVTKN